MFGGLKFSVESRLVFWLVLSNRIWRNDAMQVLDPGLQRLCSFYISSCGRLPPSSTYHGEAWDVKREASLFQLSQMRPDLYPPAKHSCTAQTRWDQQNIPTANPPYLLDIINDYYLKTLFGVVFTQQKVTEKSQRLLTGISLN